MNTFSQPPLILIVPEKWGTCKCEQSILCIVRPSPYLKTSSLTCSPLLLLRLLFIYTFLPLSCTHVTFISHFLLALHSINIELFSPLFFSYPFFYSGDPQIFFFCFDFFSFFFSLSLTGIFFFIFLFLSAGIFFL